MKYSIVSMTALLHIACSADYVTFAPSEPSWDMTVSDSGAKTNDQAGNSTRTTSISNSITFSTQHKQCHRHTAAPRYDLTTMSTTQLTHYFNTHGYTQEQILERKDLFASAAFVALAKQLPKYPEYIKKHYEEYRNFNWYTKGVGRIFSFYTPGFQATFARLYKEYKRELQAKEKREHKKQDEYAKTQGELAAYCAKIESIAHDELTFDAMPYHHQQARRQACAKIKTNSSDRTPQKHAVTRDVITFAHEYHIAEHDLTSLRGNAYEQQLHIEFLEQLTEAYTISTSYALQPHNILIDAVGHSAALGMEANRLQQPGTATAWANLGWKVLDIIEGIGEGLVLFAENTTDMILHPRHTLKQMIHGLGMLTGLVARTCAHAIGTTSYWHELMEHGDGLLMAQEMAQVAQRTKAFGAYCIEKASSLETRDIAKYGTAIAADMLLTHKIFMFGGTLCTRATPLIRDAMAHINARATTMGKTIFNVLEAAHAESPILQTAEGICMKASEELNKIGGAAIEALKNARLTLETMHAQYMVQLEMELSSLRLLFDNKVKGFAEFANKFIKIEYRHILGMDLAFDVQGRAKFSGFHHDLMNTIEKSGAIEFVNKVMHKNGFYSADLIIDDIKTPKTFFPSEWPREKVIEKIYEAYHNFIRGGVIPKPRPNEKYLISGTIAEGIDIEMWVTKKGKVVTAYPLLK
jgi:hypothetical protein